LRRSTTSARSLPTTHALFAHTVKDNHTTMATYAITKPAKGKKAGSGSGAKKASSGTKKSSSSKTAQEQAGKEFQPADEPVAVHSYTALLSGNGKYRIARFQNFKIQRVSHFNGRGF